MFDRLATEHYVARTVQSRLDWAPCTLCSISSTARLARWSFCASLARSTTLVLVGPCCGIEERMAADCHSGIGFRDLAELGTDIALARIGADSFREQAHAGLELGAPPGRALPA